MSNTIKLKRSGVSSQIPSSLEYGELAINYADGKMFYKNSSANIVEFSSSQSLNIDGGSASSIYGAVPDIDGGSA